MLGVGVALGAAKDTRAPAVGTPGVLQAVNTMSVAAVSAIRNLTTSSPFVRSLPMTKPPHSCLHCSGARVRGFLCVYVEPYPPSSLLPDRTHRIQTGNPVMRGVPIADIYSRSRCRTSRSLAPRNTDYYPRDSSTPHIYGRSSCPVPGPYLFLSGQSAAVPGATPRAGRHASELPSSAGAYLHATHWWT